MPRATRPVGLSAFGGFWSLSFGEIYHTTVALHEHHRRRDLGTCCGRIACRSISKSRDSGRGSSGWTSSGVGGKFVNFWRRRKWIGWERRERFMQVAGIKSCLNSVVSQKHIQIRRAEIASFEGRFQQGNPDVFFDSAQFGTC